MRKIVLKVKLQNEQLMNYESFKFLLDLTICLVKNIIRQVKSELVPIRKPSIFQSP